MKNGILVSLLALGLAACGGESESQAPALSINTELSAGIKGMEMEPILTDDEINSGDSAILNTNYRGYIIDGSSVRFGFTLAEDKLVALVLSSGAIDLNLLVSGNGTNFDSDMDQSNELIVVNAIAGENYSVTIESYEGGGEFQLKLVEANRSSMGMSGDEHLVRLDFMETGSCIINGVESPEQSDSYSIYLAVNWSGGYVDIPGSGGRESFSSVDGNVFTVKPGYSDSGRGWSESSQTSIIISTDFTTGAITGSASGNYDYTENDYTEHCITTSSFTGNVIF